LRVEQVKTKDDVATTVKQSELTATAALAAAANFDLVTDLRYDKDDNATLPFNGKDKMITAVIKGIYKF